MDNREGDLGRLRLLIADKTIDSGCRAESGIHVLARLDKLGGKHPGIVVRLKRAKRSRTLAPAGAMRSLRIGVMVGARQVGGRPLSKAAGSSGGNLLDVRRRTRSRHLCNQVP
jgi:hypothetical protein